MIKGVVFDLDHTLFDRYATLRVVLPEMYKRLRDKISSDLSQEAFIEGLIAGEKQHIYNGWEYTADRLVEMGIFLPGTKGEEVWHCLYTYCWPIAAVEFPFTKPMLARLRQMGLKLGIVTNGEHNCQQMKIEMLGFEQLFDEIVISGDVGVQKPAAEPFKVMSRKLDIAPENLLYVGDNPKNDVEGSRNAGYIPVWVKTIGNWCFDDIAPCEYEVDTVGQLPELIEKINGK